MTRLSVNVNKVATLRNSRGGHLPSVTSAVAVCLEAGATGITVHPRADARHITTADVHDVARMLAPLRGLVEYNIEGDPRPELTALVLEVRPDQCTLVPVVPGEITSQAGWPSATPKDALARTIAAMQEAGVRVSLFVDPDPGMADWAHALGADRVELYTEPFARAFERGEAEEAFSRYVATATRAHALGLGVNAGHDLDLDNLTLFRTLPHLDEVSIGHALMSHALFVGLRQAVLDYRNAVEGPG